MKVKKIGDIQEQENLSSTEVTVEKSAEPIIQVSQRVSTGEAKKTKYYIIGGILFVVIAALLYYILVYQKSQNSDTDLKLAKENTVSDKKITITKDEVTDFINKWASYQTNKQISDYVATYDPSFSGIKRTKTGKTYYLNYSEWIADRSSMYQKAKYLSVTLSNLSIKILTDNTAEAVFNQIYISDSYNDEGIKTLKFKKNNDGKILITNEELIYSMSLGE